MPKAGKHPEKALSAAFVKSSVTPGRFADGGGLYLLVSRSGAKQWLCRVVVRGRRRDVGLGGANTVSLAEARELAAEVRKSARAGRDPIEERKAAKRVIPTFAEAAVAVHAERKSGWKNGKHQDQWLNTLNQYAVPIIGNKSIAEIDTDDVLKVLRPIWTEKEETASRIKQRLKTIFDWAKANRFRLGDNPVENVKIGLPRQKKTGSHFKALDYSDVNRFYLKLKACKAELPTIYAFQILILTATRTQEVLKAEWGEFDLAQRIWTIPANRMKADRVHRVPLGPEIIKTLNLLKPISGSNRHVFINLRTSKPLSNMVFLQLIKRIDEKVTAHGFRSTFRDWASEVTDTPHEICEMALAHTIRDKTEKAYRRGDLFEKRKMLMLAWESHVVGQA